VNARALSSSEDSLRPTLKVSLRTEDGLDFVGISNVRVFAMSGYEVKGRSSENETETVFPDLSDGDYTIEARAPGFRTAQQETHIRADGRLRTIFLIMKPSSTTLQPAQSTRALEATETSKTLWMRPGIDGASPDTEANIDCPLSQVIAGAGKRAKELAE